jgi:hypothetical protein
MGIAPDRLMRTGTLPATGSQSIHTVNVVGVAGPECGRGTRVLELTSP